MGRKLHCGRTEIQDAAFPDGSIVKIILSDALLPLTASPVSGQNFELPNRKLPLLDSEGFRQFS